MSDKDTLIIEEATVEKAIQRGLVKMQLESKDVTVEILDEGKKGLFGFGARPAKVKLSRLVLSGDDLEEELDENINEDETSQEVLENIKELEDELDHVAVSEKDDEEDEDDELDEYDEDDEADEYDPVDEDDGKESLVIDMAHENEVIASVATYLKDVCRAYGVEAEVVGKLESRRITFQIETEKQGLVIGHHGKILDALQNLAQVLVFRDITGRYSVIVNVGDYRERRQDILKRLAHRTANRVLETGQSIILDPLPSFERKMIHSELSRNELIQTHSEGKEPHRYLVVEPKK
ncbi:protein jag [Atopobacter sp. AH10]|uniref:RNA-binding cell elongation regulator Jag/EloR n=1 Tax=Atopobacter sp. AH10 TaxID=2315861 RepID=UPI000EF20CF4|nr:RNA-binding cell elongation regulator Jag/EloR [Atopobacter sp. AH10]RLK62852.1 protein jag [Atopobacter sp. AH10]